DPARIRRGPGRLLSVPRGRADLHRGHRPAGPAWAPFVRGLRPGDGRAGGRAGRGHPQHHRALAVSRRHRLVDLRDRLRLRASGPARGRTRLPVAQPAWLRARRCGGLTGTSCRSSAVMSTYGDCVTTNDDSSRGLYPLLLRHVLRRLDAETAHRLAVRALRAAHGFPGGPALLRRSFGVPAPHRDRREAKRAVGIPARWAWPPASPRPARSRWRCWTWASVMSRSAPSPPTPSRATPDLAPSACSATGPWSTGWASTTMGPARWPRTWPGPGAP